MNIYLIESPKGTYIECAVVVASNEKQAAKIHPNYELNWDGAACDMWCAEDEVNVEYLGTADTSLFGGVSLCVEVSDEQDG